MEPGRRIEHYVIIEKIGQGGQAAVWSAYDERLKRTVAIKTIALGQFTQPDGSSAGTEPAGASALTNPDRFREEAQIIAALEHPNILPVYAFGQEDDWLYIVMRYMASGSLKDLLKSEFIPPERVAALMEPLAGALDLAHQNQIIHRDIKSANILLDAQLHPYLADFGLSMSKSSQPSEAGVGTLAYMSPEQMVGDPIDHRSDLYAFGILMYELLTGELPTVNGQPWNVHQTMSGAPLPLPERLPERIGNVLRKATALSRDDRYSSASENVAALHEAVGEAAAKAEAFQIQPDFEITDPTILALMEAHELFQKAQERWSDGAGRFRFEAGDFKYVDSYYNDAEAWSISLTDIGKRLMLRAALEHGYNLDYWWKQVVDVDDRRAVTLQTLTSELAAARLRAMQQLMDIEDSSPPAIPVRVTTLLQQEPDIAVRMAGLRLLQRRALPSLTWRRFAYNEFIDRVLAEIAVQDSDPQVSDLAARISARLRSSYAIVLLGKQASGGNWNALNALVNVRDEVPSLPTEIPSNVRQRVFFALSWRQLTADPLGLLTRYLGATLGSALMISIWAYLQFNDQNGLLASQRIGNALAAGALYGALIGIGIFFAVVFPDKLRAWNRTSRIVVGLIFGMLATTAAFSIFDRLFNSFTPRITLLLVACLGFAAGFSIATGLTRRAWTRSLAGAAGIALAVYFSWQNGKEPLLYLFEGADDQNLIFSLAVGVITSLLTFSPEWVSSLVRSMRKAAQEREQIQPQNATFWQ